MRRHQPSNGVVALLVGAALAGSCGAGPRIIELELDGFSIEPCRQTGEDRRALDDPPGCSAVATSSLTWPPFSPERFDQLRGRAQPELGQRLREAVAGYYDPFDVEVRLGNGAITPHTRVLFGGVPALVEQPDGLAGAAPIDCDDRDYGNIAFVFTDALRPDLGERLSDNLPAAAQNQDVIDIIARTAAHELGHTFGLQHSIALGLMHPNGPDLIDAGRWATGEIHPGDVPQCPQYADRALVDHERTLADALGWRR